MRHGTSRVVFPVYKLTWTLTRFENKYIPFLFFFTIIFFQKPKSDYISAQTVYYIFIFLNYNKVILGIQVQ